MLSSSVMSVGGTFLLLGYLSTTTNCIGREPAIRFYTTTNCVPAGGNTPYYNYTQTTNISNALTTGIFNSYCVIRGAWRVEMTTVQTAADYRISIGDGCSTCTNKPTLNTVRYGLVRVIAGRDLTVPVFALYTDRSFGGRETLINGKEFSFNNTYSFMSYAFTSYSNWTWQVYYLPRFVGNWTCHRPNPMTEVTLVDLQVLNIGSLRLGCRNDAPPDVETSGTGLIIGLIVAFTIPSVAVIL